MRKIFTFFFLFLIFGISSAQQASAYFPTQTGFKWEFKQTPLDSANNPIPSLASFRIDSFANIANFQGRLANIVPTKTGSLVTIPFQPFTDSLFYNTDGTDGYEYFSIRNIEAILQAIDSAGTIPNFNLVEFFTSLQDWYPVYQFTSNVNAEYLLKQVDTSVFINPFTVPIQFNYVGKRLEDETIQTLLGSYDCKKFLTQWKVSASILFTEYNLLTTNDTIWIAPDNWIVQDIIPGQYVNLDSLPFVQIDPIGIIGLETKLTNEIVVTVGNEESIPNTLSLEQNYPNPFNPSTKIRFTIPSVIASGTKQSQLVTLKVYDILGSELATLVDEEKPAGIYEVNFNAVELPSGIYFYKLQVGFFVETKKMVLMK
jgi:hypothetical protein